MRVVCRALERGSKSNAGALPWNRQPAVPTLLGSISALVKCPLPGQLAGGGGER